MQKLCTSFLVMGCHGDNVQKKHWHHIQSMGLFLVDYMKNEN